MLVVNHVDAVAFVTKSHVWMHVDGVEAVEWVDLLTASRTFIFVSWAFHEWTKVVVHVHSCLISWANQAHWVWQLDDVVLELDELLALLHGDVILLWVISSSTTSSSFIISFMSSYVTTINILGQCSLVSCGWIWRRSTTRLAISFILIRRSLVWERFDSFSSIILAVTTIICASLNTSHSLVLLMILSQISTLFLIWCWGWPWTSSCWLLFLSSVHWSVISVVPAELSHLLYWLPIVIDDVALVCKICVQESSENHNLVIWYCYAAQLRALLVLEFSIEVYQLPALLLHIIWLSKIEPFNCAQRTSVVDSTTSSNGVNEWLSQKTGSQRMSLFGKLWKWLPLVWSYWESFSLCHCSFSIPSTYCHKLAGHRNFNKSMIWPSIDHLWSLNESPVSFIELEQLSPLLATTNIDLSIHGALQNGAEIAKGMLNLL